MLGFVSTVLSELGATDFTCQADILFIYQYDYSERINSLKNSGMCCEVIYTWGIISRMGKREWQQ